MSAVATNLAEALKSAEVFVDGDWVDADTARWRKSGHRPKLEM